MRLEEARALMCVCERALARLEACLVVDASRRGRLLADAAGFGESAPRGFCCLPSRLGAVVAPGDDEFSGAALRLLASLPRDRFGVDDDGVDCGADSARNNEQCAKSNHQVCAHLFRRRRASASTPWNCESRRRCEIPKDVATGAAGRRTPRNTPTRCGWRRWAAAVAPQRRWIATGVARRRAARRAP